MNLSGAICRESFTNDNDWQNYYKDKNNFNEDTIWLNPASGDYIHPEQMEFNIQGLVRKDFMQFDWLRAPSSRHRFESSPVNTLSLHQKSGRSKDIYSYSNNRWILSSVADYLWLILEFNKCNCKASRAKFSIWRPQKTQYVEKERTKS